jgi:hypothetical protein
MAESAPKRPKTDMMAEVRVALRAAERAEWIGNMHEIKYLREQVESIRYEAPVSKDAELGLIVAQLEQKAARDRVAAAAEANCVGMFTCSICMDTLSLDQLHVNVPCGHGFCKRCIGKSWEGKDARDARDAKDAKDAPAACFSCRGKVACVVQTFV